MFFDSKEEPAPAYKLLIRAFVCLQGCNVLYQVLYFF